MRHELKRLEGGLAYFRARIKEWQEGPDHRDYLLSSVQVWPWDGHSPVGQGKAIKLDHLWHRVPTEDTAALAFERLQSVNGVGQVGWYARRDGSIDLALRGGLCMDLDNQIEAAAAALEEPGRGVEREEEVLHLLRGGLAALHATNAHAYSVHHTRAELIKVLSERAIFFERLVEGTKARLEAAPIKPKPRGLDLPLRNCRKRRRLGGVA